MNLENIFKSINKKMLLDFNEISSEINHRPSKGKVREIEVINEYLKKYIPGNIGVANGEIISSDDQVSNETDIIFYEKNSTPFLLQKEGFQVFPIECIYGGIEVKSFLDGTQLKDSFKKINKLKKMPKVAFDEGNKIIKSTTNLYDKEWNYFPTLGFIIAFDSIDLKTLKAHLDKISKNELVEHRIDSIWILNKGAIINLNRTSGQLELAPSKNTVTQAMLSDNPLMLLTIQLQSLLQSAWMPMFLIQRYLGNADYGKFYR